MMHQNKNHEAILLIDDEPVSRKVTGKILSKMGFVVNESDTGLEGLKLLTPETKMALIDYNLPDITGFDLFSKIREVSPSLPIAVISGNPPESEMEQIISDGRCYFLQKPFTIDDLSKILEKEHL